MGGIGVRIFELAQVLAKKYDVTILCKSPLDCLDSRIKIKEFSEYTWRWHVKNTDALYMLDLPEAHILYYAYCEKKQIICENSPPIEHLDYSSVVNANNSNVAYRDIVAQFVFQVLVSDLFVVHSDVNYRLIVSSLCSLGRINYETYSKQNQLNSLVVKLPIGFNSFSDARVRNFQNMPTSTSSKFVWSGGVWDYYDTSFVTDAAKILRSQNVQVRFNFLYSPPENQSINEFDRLLANIKANDLGQYVEISRKQITHYERDALLADIAAFICIGRDTVENNTCVRLRIRDVFLYQKPIIVDSFGETGKMVDALGIGLTVSSSDELATAIKRLLHDKELYLQIQKNISECRKNFLLENNITDLEMFIDSGRLSHDRNSVTLNKRLKTLQEFSPKLLQKQERPI